MACQPGPNSSLLRHHAKDNLKRERPTISPTAYHPTRSRRGLHKAEVSRGGSIAERATAQNGTKGMRGATKWIRRGVTCDTRGRLGTRKPWFQINIRVAAVFPLLHVFHQPAHHRTTHHSTLPPHPSSLQPCQLRNGANSKVLSPAAPRSSGLSAIAPTAPQTSAATYVQLLSQPRTQSLTRPLLSSIVFLNTTHAQTWKTVDSKPSTRTRQSWRANGLLLLRWP